uniref:RRM domain-containing protein n=1 Tax=Taenia asiatica TaxID=60517 RepID=A0A0R3WBD6_TAEAS
LAIFTVINTTIAGGVQHYLYAVPNSPTDVKVYNIPPFFTTTSLREFFVSFGPLVRLVYDKKNCHAYVSYRRKKSANKLIAAPMTVSYAFPLPKATFNQIVDDSKSSWMKNPELLKKESEEFLQQYFKEKLSRGEDSDEESAEWTVVRPKKRRLR